MPHIRPQHVVDSALLASDLGMSDAENAEVHGVAIKTIRRWRRLYQRRGLPRGQTHTDVPCPRCTPSSLDGPAYAELLGWYLGDGHISAGRRNVWALHIYNDRIYTTANARLLQLMATVKPGGRPHTREVPGCVITTISWKHWPCLFPQHGPGRKHERTIALEAWQERIVDERPGDFLRGLFHSDGSRTNNWTQRLVAGEMKRYDYPRWEFSNRSSDIHGMCQRALDRVSIPWRQPSAWVTSVATRPGVAALDNLIGLKS